MTDYRASEPNASVRDAQALIADVSEPQLQSDHPRMPRDALLRAMRQGLQRDKFTLQPACWVSGFNGVGRESLIRDLNRSLTPNGTGIVIEINEATLPRQLLLRIESEAFGADLPRLESIVQSKDEGDTGAVAEAVERLFQAGNFLILRHGRIVQEEVELPEWLDDVAKALKPSTRPKLFIISQQPLSGERLMRCKDAVTPFRVPTVGEQEMLEFCFQLIGHFDKNPVRWPDDELQRVSAAAGGTVGFLVSIVRSASRIESFDDIDSMLAREGDRMGEAITAYVRWAFSRLREYHDDQKTLLFLNDVSPCHIVDLENAVVPEIPMLRVLSRLINFGLVERESDSIYRLTPLLANRLNRDLIRPELLHWIGDAQRRFAGKPFDVATLSVDGQHEFIRLESKIQSALLSGTDALPNRLATFVSAAHWFQAGIRLYHARKWKPAYRLLAKAYAQRLTFRDASRMEIDRYYCLAATRMRDYEQSEKCIKKLNFDYRTKAIAAFLKADMLEYRREFVNAARYYESALTLNKNKDRRREFIFRPLIRCILEAWRPDFERAERYAIQYINLKKTVFSLNSLARVYLEWKFRGPQLGLETPSDIDRLYVEALNDLERDPGAGAAPFELYSKEAVFSGNYPKAIENMDTAIRMDPDRFQLRAERWRLMASFGKVDIAKQAIRELDEARNDPSTESIWPSYIHSLAETYVRALKVTKQSFSLASGFAPELQKEGDLGRIIARMNRSE